MGNGPHGRGAAAGAIGPDDLRKAAGVIEAAAACSGTLASLYMVNVVLLGTTVAMAGSAAQKAEILPQIRAGTLQLAFAMTEPEAGSDAAAMTTRAQADGNGFRLDGEKIYTTGAATADRMLVVARTGGAGDKRAFGLFLVRSGAPGLTVEPLETVAGGTLPSCRVRLDGVRVDAEDVLGGVGQLGQAWTALKATGSIERLMVAALARGLASAVVARALAFARTRRQFGQPIASFQAIQHALVEMRTAEEGMRLFVENALAAVEAGGDATQAICMAKYVCAEQLQQILAAGMRILGGRAYFTFEEMSRYYREAPFSLYAGGTIEVQKMLIARTLGL